MKTATTTLFLGLGATLALAACGSPMPSESNGDDGAGTAAIVPMEYAVGWDGIEAISSGAEIKITSTGHFSTNRNSCFFTADSGAAEVHDWNDLARGMNAAMKLTPLTEEKCFDVTRVPYALDNFAEVKLASGKRPLFDSRGSQVCTKIPDLELAKTLLTSLNKVLKAAQIEGCPAGFGDT